MNKDFVILISIEQLVNHPEEPCRQAESSKSITPVKILSCKICVEEFIDLKDLEYHYQTFHTLESEDKTGSDALTEQDIDEMISDPNFVPIHPKIVIQEYDMVG